MNHLSIKVESGMRFCSLTLLNTLIGKNVFKKAVKLTKSVVPTQTNQNAPTMQRTSSAESGPEAGEAIVFDGKTFTVAFSQISGVY